MIEPDAQAWLRLALSVSAGQARALLSQIGLPDAVFSASFASLERASNRACALALTEAPSEAVQSRLDAALAWLEGEGCSLLTLSDADYPQNLLNIADPPVLLYCRGSRALLKREAIAIVGSRNPTTQGEQNAASFAKALSDAGLVVVSGLALGVDAAAHRGALLGASRTIAVIGTGIDRIYPARNQALTREIAERGLVVSEYAIGTPPLKENFPRRNRLISGLSRGVLVVEAAVHSGSLITARMAGEQGREVLAIPGSIHSPQARGCHLLIKEGAKLVESAEDVLSELSVHPRLNIETAVQDQAVLHPILDALGFDPCSMDELQARTGLSTADLAAQLLDLELDGRVSRLGDGSFQRIHIA